MVGEIVTPLPTIEEMRGAFQWQAERLIEDLGTRKEKEDAFKEKYGEDLFAYSNAYLNRARISSLLTEVDYPNFSSLILAHIKSQPVDQREKWLAGYLKNLEGLRRR